MTLGMFLRIRKEMLNINRQVVLRVILVGLSLTFFKSCYIALKQTGIKLPVLTGFHFNIQRNSKVALTLFSAMQQPNG